MIPPEPDPPLETYSLTASIAYALSTVTDQAYTLILSYKAYSDSEWVVIDSASLVTKAYGNTDSVVLDNIPQGCYSVKLDIASVSSSYTASMKTRNDTTWGSSISYGSGNEGWNQDYQTDIDVRVKV